MDSRKRETRSLKCLVWDLDETLWDGVLIEGDDVRPRVQALEAIHELDQRGILQSIASKNDHRAASAKLADFGIQDYFLHPQINWGPKSQSVKRIADSLNIGLDSIGLLDDQAFEREEVQFSHPEVLCIDAVELPRLLEIAELKPRFVTEDSKLRRSLYRADIQRNEVELGFSGTQAEFLATLGMKLTIERARAGDLERAEELTERTHQLNSTGYTYSYEELDAFRSSPDHLLLVATLEDKYGSYGRIGLALVELGESCWTLRLLLMSCRVMSRGVGTIMLSYVMRAARQSGVGLKAEFVPTDRNRTMHVTFRLSGFRRIERRGVVEVLQSDLERVPPIPGSVEVSAPAPRDGTPGSVLEVLRDTQGLRC